MATQNAQFVAPNFYEQAGDGIHVSYAPVYVGGRPHLTSQDRAETLNFRGDGPATPNS
jgi:hypothetical protein